VSVVPLITNIDDKVCSARAWINKKKYNRRGYASALFPSCVAIEDQRLLDCLQELIGLDAYKALYLNKFNHI
jgi:hypothetical protein